MHLFSVDKKKGRRLINECGMQFVTENAAYLSFLFFL